LEALVRRHGPMAWGVCRRILKNYHDAEDAFQATFLVLVRRAASIVPREMVANWLYGVAYRTALKARTTIARRRRRESQVANMPEPEAARPGVWHDLQAVLDEELCRLPDKYRVPIVLCDLEGKTRKEAARRLGWPAGTVAGRLARARKLLAESLARRGIVLSGGALAGGAMAGGAMAGGALAGGALAVELSRNAASASAPAALVVSTIKAATLFAAGQAAAGAISARVAALTEGVLQTMALTKHKTALVILLVAVLGLGGAGLGWATHAAEDALPPQQSAPKTRGTKHDDDNLKNTLLALDKHWREAASRGEWQEIEKFYASDYLGVGTVGKSRRAANVEAVKTHRPADWKIRDVDFVRVSKDSAALTYIYDCKVLAPDGRLLQTRRHHRLTSVWGQRNGGWVLVYCHDEHGRSGVVTNYAAEGEGLRRIEVKWRYIELKKPATGK
jgi:RNA polymerase sigma factor (sigma-70 family)